MGLLPNRSPFLLSSCSGKQQIAASLQRKTPRAAGLGAWVLGSGACLAPWALARLDPAFLAPVPVHVATPSTVEVGSNGILIKYLDLLLCFGFGGPLVAVKVKVLQGDVTIIPFVSLEAQTREMPIIWWLDQR